MCVCVCMYIYIVFYLYGILLVLVCYIIWYFVYFIYMLFYCSKSINRRQYGSNISFHHEKFLLISKLGTLLCKKEILECKGRRQTTVMALGS